MSSDNYLSETDREFVLELDKAARLIYTVDSAKIHVLVQKVRAGVESIDALSSSSETNADNSYARLEQYINLADIRLNYRKNGMVSTPDRIAEYYAARGRAFRRFYEGVPLD